MNWFFSIITSLVSFFIGGIINFLHTKFKYRLRKEEGFTTFKNKFKEEVFLFRVKETTRISVGVLAAIEYEKKILCHKPKTDNQWKPVGGCIKMNEFIKKNLSKISNFYKDKTSPYRAKGNDFRTDVYIKNNKQILNMLRKIDDRFLIKELQREIIEELRPGLSKKNFNDILKIVEKRNIQNSIKKRSDSHLEKRDMVYQFIYAVKILNYNKFNKILKQTKKKISWIDVSERKKNISITAFWAKNIVQ